MAVALTQSRGIDRCRQVRAGKDNTQMTEMARPFGGEVRRLMAVRGVGLREPAGAPGQLRSGLLIEGSERPEACLSGPGTTG